MNSKEILKSIKNPNGGIILTLNINSNPDEIVKNIINKFTGLSLNSLDNYIDLIKINASTKSINKNDILNIKNQFAHRSIVDNKLKIYYLKNIDKVNNFSFSALLKFLEEPQDNILGIFTTKNISNIPQTIVSRCQTYSLEADELALKEILTKNQISNTDWLANVFYDINEITEAIDNPNLSILNQLYYFFTENKLEDIKSHWDSFKKLDYKEIELLLEILILNSNNQKSQYLMEIIEEIKFNPIKYLLFNKIFMIMEK